MQHTETVVIGGVDAHTDAHHVAALDRRGALLGTESFATTTRGYGELLDWLGGFGSVAAVAVESTGAYAGVRQLMGMRGGCEGGISSGHGVPGGLSSRNRLVSHLGF